MSTYRLEHLFAPKSVALVGASPRERSVGRMILRNLREAGFAGSIGLVNPKYPEIEGIRAVKTIADLPAVPDLVIVAAPPPTVPEVVATAAAKGAPSAIIITAGLGHGTGSLAEAARQAARAHGLRLIGPNSLGVLVPRARLNASFASRSPRAGDLALISQSGAIAAGMIEWAAQRDVGFSAIVSLGDQADVDFGDLLDFFALDRGTRAILLYIESIGDARKFMTAARAAARIKPVVVVKSGRHRQGARAAATHTGALAGADAVYDAAFRRAGLLRVLDLDELFAAAETLGRLRGVPGKRLAILTNGGGIGVLAVDRLADLGGTLAELAPETTARLDAALPPIWSRANPVDIAGDADETRYAAALEGLLADPANDAILVMNVPTALASAAEAARSVAAVMQKHRNTVFHAKPVFAVWIGGGRRLQDLRSRGHSELCDRNRRGRGLYALGPLPRGDRSLDGDAAEHAGGVLAGCRRGAPHHRRRDPRRPRLARSDRGHASARGLFDPDRAGLAGARCRRSRRGGGAAHRRRRHRRGQDPVARHRAQVGGRRRAAQSDQRARRA